MNGWLTALVGIASALLGGGGVAAFISAFTGRHQRRAEVTDRLSDLNLKWVQEFQEETARARAEAREETRQARLEASETRQEMAVVRREMAEVRREAEGLARDLRNLRGAIMSPSVTLERLRAMVGGEGLNGR